MTRVKKRWSSLDVLRTASFALILLYHFMVEIEADGHFAFAQYGITYENSNLHMAKIGVTLFFMMSGFGLMTGSMSGFSLKEYAKKRFVRILIPYYVVSLLVFLCALILSDGPVFEESIPLWRIIFTALGLDGYVKEYGLLTFHLGVGEWFIGCLILMYLVFPLLRKAMLKKSDITVVAATVCYLILLVFYKGNVPVHYFFSVKLYDFILGMYLGMKLKETSWKYSVVTGIAAVVLLVIPIELPLNEDYPNVIFSLLLFLGVFHLEGLKRVKKAFDCKILKWIAKYSYEMFLIHHWAIIVMIRVLKPQTLVSAGLCLVFVVAGVFAVGGGLYYLIESMKRKM